MGIYTKQGDKGETKVFDKKTGKLIGISKKSCKIRAIGAIDELNSFLGIVSSFCTDKKLSVFIREVQGNLFTINAVLAGSNLRFSKTKVKKLERLIDRWEGELPVQKNFIFYGGSQLSSLLFYARAICRRSERSLTAFNHQQSVNPTILAYVNRLSDYLFIMARKVNFDEKRKEEYWIGIKKR